MYLIYLKIEREMKKYYFIFSTYLYIYYIYIIWNYIIFLFSISSVMEHCAFNQNYKIQRNILIWQ